MPTERISTPPLPALARRDWVAVRRVVPGSLSWISCEMNTVGTSGASAAAAGSAVATAPLVVRAAARANATGRRRRGRATPLVTRAKTDMCLLWDEQATLHRDGHLAA